MTSTSAQSTPAVPTAPGPGVLDEIADGVSNGLRHQPVACAICGPDAPYRVRYAARIPDGPIDFAARKVPQRHHFRICECSRCGLVFSNPILDVSQICQLYREAEFVGERQMENMARDYRRQAEVVLPLLPATDAMLEIACSNGFFLKTGLELGFKTVVGVEPGDEAVASADPEIRRHIVHDFFSADRFEPETFDFICCFQALDHFVDPNAIFADAWKLLKPGGVVLCLNHNIRSWLPRVLGERSPMYDIEHIHLFNTKTVAEFFRTNGYEVLSARNVPNSYTFSYAAKMFPMPAVLKTGLLAVLKRLAVGEWRVRLPAGNMVCVARKPRAASAGVSGRAAA